VRMMSASHVVDINGPNCCEVLDPAQAAALVARIGPDVLRADADPERAWARITRSRVAIGQMLMDQSVIAGIGNIYRSEILWRQRVHPTIPGTAITRETFDRIWADAVHLLAIGVEKNAIITVDGVQAARTRYRERVNILPGMWGGDRSIRAGDTAGVCLCGVPAKLISPIRGLRSHRGARGSGDQFYTVQTGEFVVKRQRVRAAGLSTGQMDDRGGNVARHR
jgi:hypothetical protein